jgi:hypothetical protein
LRLKTPALRAEGLASDRLGDAIDFFGLSDRDAHHALCSCHLGSTFEARVAAQRIKALVDRRSRDGGIFGRLVSALFAR